MAGAASIRQHGLEDRRPYTIVTTSQQLSRTIAKPICRATGGGLSRCPSHQAAPPVLVVSAWSDCPPHRTGARPSAACRMTVSMSAGCQRDRLPILSGFGTVPSATRRQKVETLMCSRAAASFTVSKICLGLIGLPRNSLGRDKTLTIKMSGGKRESGRKMRNLGRNYLAHSFQLSASISGTIEVSRQAAFWNAVHVLAFRSFRSGAI